MAKKYGYEVEEMVHHYTGVDMECDALHSEVGFPPRDNPMLKPEREDGKWTTEEHLKHIEEDVIQTIVSIDEDRYDELILEDKFGKNTIYVTKDFFFKDRLIM